MQKMTDPPLAEDPETGVPLERIFHPIAVHFKGKGFYNTDYGTKKRAREKADHEGSKKSESSSGDSSSSSSDAKKGESSSGDSSAKSDTVSKAEPAPKPSKSSKSD